MPQRLNAWALHRDLAGAAAADPATYDAATFPTEPINAANKAFDGHGLETVLVHWRGTGGVVNTDNITIEMLIWDGVNSLWTRFESKALKMFEVGEFLVHHSARCFARISAVSTTATALKIYTAHGKDARAR